MFRRFLAVIVGVLVCINLLWIPPVRGAGDISIIRVKLSSLGTLRSIDISLDGYYTISQIDKTSLLAKGEYTVRVDSGRLVLDDKTKSQTVSTSLGNGFTFKQYPKDHPNHLKIGNYSYRGDMEVRLVDSSIELINHVHLETYLYGVVPYEVSNSWPIEAQKAQAIAARTYAISSRKPNSYYDVVNTTNDQVYRGYNPSYTNSIRAVDETFGQVLKYGNSYVQTFYSSSNGGWTESTENLWGGKLAYSKVTKDPYDRMMGNATRGSGWSVTYLKSPVDSAFLTRIKFADFLAGKGLTIADVENIAIKELNFTYHNNSTDTSKGDRVNGGNIVFTMNKKNDKKVVEMDIAFTQKKDNKRTRFDIRSLFRTDSTFFDLKDKGNSFVLEGGGWGHGIGMSQWGSYYRAKDGLKYDAILYFYYPGTTLNTLSIETDRGWDRPVITDPEEPGEGDVDPEEPGEGDVDPEEPGEGDVDPEEPGEGDVDPEEPGEGDVDPEEPGEGDVDPEEPGEGDVDPEEPGEGDVDPEEPGEGDVDPEEPGEGDVDPKEPGEGDVDPEEPGEGDEDPEEPGEGDVDPEDPNSGNEKEQQFGRVIASVSVNVRRGAGTNYGVVGILYNGDKIEILDRSGAWYKIKTGNLEGYAHGDYIVLEDTEKPVTPPPTEEEPQQPGTTDPAPPPTDDRRYGIVTATALNVRSGPSTKNHVVGIVINGARLTVLGSQDSWYKVSYNGKDAYVYGEYLKLENPVPKPPTPPVDTIIGKATVTAHRVNVRKGAGTGHSILGVVANGDRVEVLAKQGDWYKIKYGNGIGYVYGGYFKMENTKPNPPTPPADTIIGKATVTAHRVNVRKGAGTGHSILGVVANGDRVEVLAKQGDWYKIKYGNGIGYVYGGYFKMENTKPNPPTPPADTIIGEAIVTAHRVNVRKGAGTSHSILGVVANGDRVEVLEKQGDWYKIKYGNGIGYVYGEYFKMISDSSDRGTVERTGIVTATALNVRTGPGTNYSRIKILYNGDKISILGESGSWYKIQTGSTIGYVSKQYIR